jgi:3',5'-cyclic AMP phosphodiesterase CpdA
MHYIYALFMTFTHLISRLKQGVLIFAALSAMAISGLAWERDYPTLEGSKIAWSFEPGRRIVAIADIHGDYNALVTILRGARLIDRDGKWIGGPDTHVVLTGDLINKGSDSRLVMDLVMRLERQAPGLIHPLLGNHELYVSAGRYGAMQAEDIEAYDDVGTRSGRRHVIPAVPDYLQFDGSGYSRVKAAFSRNTRYARWIRSRNAIVKIGDHLFSHAGILPEWGGDASLGRVNATIRAWIAYFQGAQSRPAWATRWVIEEATSPLSNRAFRPDRRPRYETSEIKAMLRAQDAKHMYVGHYLTDEREIVLEHPFYPKRVTLLDSGNSDFYGGTLSALEIRGDERRVLTFERPSEDVALREREPVVRRQAIRERLASLSDRAVKTRSKLERSLKRYR